ALGDEVEGATKRRLYTHSAGNPLFLRELVLAGLDSGALLFVDGLWSWEGPFKPSPRLAELIGRRLEGFSPEATRALELIALGEPVPVAILESLVERADLSELEQGRVVAEGVEGARRFARLAHPMYGEMVRAGVAPARAREVAAELAGAFASTGARRRDDLLRVATWRLEAGLSEEPGVLAAAAQQALALTDFELAEQLSRAAVGGGAPEAGEVLARSLVGQGRFGEADDLLAGIERAVGSRLERVAVSSARAHNLLWNLSEYDRSLDVLDTAASEVSDPGTRLTLDAVKSYFLWLTGRAEDAIGSGLAILEDPLAGDLAVFHSFSAVGQASIFAGHPDRALDLLERHRERLQRVLPQVAFGPIAFAILEASAGLMSGSLGDARGSLEQRYREALERDAEWVRALIGGLLGAVIRAQGRVTPAARLLRESAALLRRNDVIGQLQAVLSELAVALAESGDAEGAAEALHEAEERTALPPLRVYLSQARIWVLAAQGSVREAIASAQEEADELASMGLLGGASLALHASVRLGAPGPVADRLDDLTAGSDSELLLTMSTHATALARRDAAGLEEVASRYEAMPALLLAAEALAQAADLHRRASRAARAHVSTRRALRLLAECPGAATPALQGLGAALPLSAREREVATLAARGLSNKEIAEQLHISIRTVGNHLHRTYRRLGIAGRKELEELI
ncbi:MAG TPA: helix-turn-helix transcriptional regulator, partial [Actinomycetota bacterium]|nr:helix-turn-helix transcriptional regulator [Actinomycetota bacterium]